MSAIPAAYLDLIERPLFAHLATVKPDSTPQVTPVWFEWDGQFLALTTSTLRRKYHHILANPQVALSVTDPDRPYRYLEVRGTVESIEPDENADFFFQLADRYHLDISRGGLDDAPHRVKVRIRPTHCSFQG